MLSGIVPPLLCPCSLYHALAFLLSARAPSRMPRAIFFQTLNPLSTLITFPTMANEGDPSQLRAMSLDQAHKMKRDIAIIKLQDQVKMLTNEIPK